MTRKGVSVISDPSGLFEPGAEFSLTELVAGVHMGTWPLDITFRMREKDGMEYDARMIGKVLLRVSDGATLRTDSGSSCEWIKE